MAQKLLNLSQYSRYSFVNKQVKNFSNKNAATIFDNVGDCVRETANLVLSMSKKIIREKITNFIPNFNFGCEKLWCSLSLSNTHAHVHTHTHAQTSNVFTELTL